MIKQDKLSGNRGRADAMREAGEFDGLRLGYAGTIYKGQGRTLDQTYVFHSHYWREASSYVALTRHRDDVAIFVAHDTAADLDRLARQMGRDETKRAAVTFIAEDRGPDRPRAPAMSASEMAMREAANLNRRSAPTGATTDVRSARLERLRGEIASSDGLSRAPTNGRTNGGQTPSQ